MDQKDVYNQLKNAFLLGNYHKVFEFLKDYTLDDLSIYKEEICSLIVRSFLALEDRQTPEMHSFLEGIPDLNKIYELFSPFMIPLIQVNFKKFQRKFFF